MTSVNNNLPTPAEIYDRFSSGGHLDADAAASYISQKTGQSVTADTLKQHLDKDGDGNITRDEFIKNSPRPGQPGAPPMAPATSEQQSFTSDPQDEELLAAQRKVAHFQRFV
jgi:hypothetical protein